jgi:hypothetical protein
MSMAHLIMKIAMDRSRDSDVSAISGSKNAFKCCSHDDDSLPPSRQTIIMLKSVFTRSQPSPPLANNTILKTEEFRVHSGPAPDLEMQQQSQQDDREIFDGSSIISYTDSVAWHNVDWRHNCDEHHDTASSKNTQAASSANEEAHLARPAPTVLRPS